jgi:hypothetical protein
MKLATHLHPLQKFVCRKTFPHNTVYVNTTVIKTSKNFTFHIISKDGTLTVSSSSSISKFIVIRNALSGRNVSECSVTASKPREKIIAIQYSIQQPKENL